MFAAREFIIEWARLLLVGDTWAGRAVRWVSFLVFGLLAVFSERLHFLIWGPGWIRIWPLHGELGIGASLVLVIGIFYASITAGAAWTRTRRVQVMFRYPACDRCLVGNQVELEVWNRSHGRPIEDVHVFVDSLEPGFAARLELEWSGEGRIGKRPRPGGYGHVDVLTFNSDGCFLLIAPAYQLAARQYVARLTVESELGSWPARLLIDPSAHPPISVSA